MKTIQCICLIIFLVLSGCAVPRYEHKYKTPKGLNFKEGQWLINDIKGEPKNKEFLEDLLMQKMKQIAKDSIFHIKDIRPESMIAKDIPFQMDSMALSNLKTISSFDFLFNVRTKVLKDEAGDLILFPNDNKYESKVMVEFVVYQLSNCRRIYYQKITGSVVVQANNEDLYFAKSAQSLLKGSIKQAFKEIETYSYY